jgi:hypothetical protein
MKVLLISEGKHELEGSLRTLVQRIAHGLDEIEQVKVTHPALRTHGGTGHGYFKKAVRCMLYAQEQAYEAVVLVIDQDDEPERRRELSKAQDHTLATIRRALGVAIRTFDAWMLADEKALSQVLGTTIQRQPDPETIADGKSICRELLSSSERQLSQTEMYAELAEVIRLDELERRCPDGFGVFAERVRRI